MLWQLMPNGAYRLVNSNGDTTPSDSSGSSISGSEKSHAFAPHLLRDGRLYWVVRKSQRKIGGKFFTWQDPRGLRHKTYYSRSCLLWKGTRKLVRRPREDTPENSPKMEHIAAGTRQAESRPPVDQETVDRIETSTGRAPEDEMCLDNPYILEDLWDAPLTTSSAAPVGPSRWDGLPGP